MVKHIVMFKLAEKNPENLDQAVVTETLYVNLALFVNWVVLLRCF